jgi:lysyl-tRNA synthetase, class II
MSLTLRHSILDLNMTMSSREEELYRERLTKLNRLRERGIDPYPTHFDRTHTSTAAVAAFEAAEAAGTDAPTVTVSVAGRLTALRRMGKAAFLDLQDGEGRIQVFARADNLNPSDFETLKDDVDLGDILGVSGPLIRTRTGEISVQAESLTMLAKSLQTPPEKFHGLTDTEQRYRQRYRDLIANEETRDLFRLRSRVVSAIRRFLDARGFIDVETPILTDQSGGAAARPFVTHHNVLERDLYLRIATELHLKRLIVGGFDKVYEIGRIFRNEGLSWKHSPEYTMLESYEAYAGYEDVMRMLEDMVSAVAQECLGRTRIKFGEEEVELAPPWRRLPLRDALIEYADLDPEQFRDIESLKSRMIELGVEPEAGAGWGKLIDQVQSEFVEPKLIQPTFLLDYPIELSPLAKQKPGDEHYVERFEAFVVGFEVANAYSELNDPIEQRRRFIEQARLREAGDEETESVDEDYLTALEHGMPPTGGLGVGIDRLIMLLSGRHNIREVILFPTLREKQ